MRIEKYLHNGVSCLIAGEIRSKREFPEYSDEELMGKDEIQNNKFYAGFVEFGIRGSVLSLTGKMVEKHNHLSLLDENGKIIIPEYNTKTFNYIVEKVSTMNNKDRYIVGLGDWFDVFKAVSYEEGLSRFGIIDLDFTWTMRRLERDGHILEKLRFIFNNNQDLLQDKVGITVTCTSRDDKTIRYKLIESIANMPDNFNFDRILFDLHPYKRNNGRAMSMTTFALTLKRR